MEKIFPLGFPLATAFYLFFYVFTLVIHVVFMNYVIAGTGYLAVSALRRGGPAVSPSAQVLREWMPFMLSFAITAGIAPLLFVQILYKHAFYTSNLLLFHRWMAILPVLIVGFYMLYLLKSKTIARWPGIVSVIVSLIALACFFFTGYSWTENHLLSVAGQKTWSTMYASGSMIYHDPQLLPRLSVWLLGAIPTMALLLSWQLWAINRCRTPVPSSEIRKLASLAILGLVAAGVAWNFFFLPTTQIMQHVALTPLAGPYFFAALIGLALQVLGWAWMFKSGQYDYRPLLLTSLGCVISTASMTVVREAIRLHAVDISQLYDQHAQSLQVGGFVVFLFFFIFNAVGIAWCIRICANAGPSQGETSLAAS